MPILPTQTQNIDGCSYLLNALVFPPLFSPTEHRPPLSIKLCTGSVIKKKKVTICFTQKFLVQSKWKITLASKKQVDLTATKN